MDIEVTQVSDEVLTLAAAEKGPFSAEAQVMARIRMLRAKDRQVFAYRVGGYLIASPVPDAWAESVMIAFAEEND
jgi:hypothetical protein